MFFVDQCRIKVRAGKGGQGCVSFRREKRTPRGGPDGGDGGRGGDVLLVASTHIHTLSDIRRAPLYAARNGRPGEGSGCSGKAGEDLTVDVPLGTLVRAAGTEAPLADLDRAGARFTAGCGGKGGRGNRRFKSATRRAPRICEPGRPGEERTLDLELMIVADVGFVGLPNAGKSSLLAALSKAHPRVAAYPFTTLAPELGVMEGPGYRRLVLAEIPGIIEGAHEGRGLGLRFLRHAGRTLALVHLVDLVPDRGEPAANVEALRREIALHGEGIVEVPTLVVGTKLDLPGAQAALENLRRKLGPGVFGISAKTGRNLDRLRNRIEELLAGTPQKG